VSFGFNLLRYPTTDSANNLSSRSSSRNASESVVKLDGPGRKLRQPSRI